MICLCYGILVFFVIFFIFVLNLKVDGENNLFQENLVKRNVELGIEEDEFFDDILVEDIKGKWL